MYVQSSDQKHTYKLQFVMTHQSVILMEHWTLFQTIAHVLLELIYQDQRIELELAIK